MSVITKADLVEKLMETGNYEDKKQAINAVENTLAQIKKELIEGNEVSVRGFGNWRIKTTKTKSARNITAKKAMIVPPKNIVKFLPSKDMKGAIKQP